MLSRAFLMSFFALLALAACETAPTPVEPRDEPPVYVVFFDRGLARIGPWGLATIKQAADEAKKPGVKAVAVTGHADNAGSEKVNQAMSLRRAQAVRDRLIREGVPATLVSTSGLGKSKPFMATEDGVGQPENRRVEIKISR